jgi:hypothetical protein
MQKNASGRSKGSLALSTGLKGLKFLQYVKSLDFKYLVPRSKADSPAFDRLRGRSKAESCLSTAQHDLKKEVPV